MIRFTYIWQAFMVLFTLGAIVVGFWGLTDGLVLQPITMFVYALTGCVYFYIGSVWRETARIRRND